MLPTCPLPPGRTIRRWDFIPSDSIRRRWNSCLGCNIVAVHGSDANCDSSCRPFGSNRCSGGTIGQQRSTGQSAGAWNRLCSAEFFRAADKNLSRWRYNPATLSVRIDKQQPILWLHKKPVRIDPLSLNERQLVVLTSDGKRIQSFWFQFADYKDVKLCLYFDGYQGVQLGDKQGALWCRCK
jgi:hypothetical protein